MRSDIILIVIALSLFGCTSGERVQPRAPDSPRPTVQESQLAVAASAGNIAAHAAGVRADAAAIDHTVAGTPQAPAVAPHTEDLRSRSAQLDATAQTLNTVTGKLDAALKLIDASRADLDRARAAEAAAIKRAEAAEAAAAKAKADAAKAIAEAQRSGLVRLMLICIAAGAGVLAYTLFVTHDIKLGVAGVGTCWGSAVIFGLWAQWLTQILLWGGLAIIAAAIGGLVYLWRSGRLTYPALTGGLKLIIEGKITEGLAALRTDPDIAKAWDAAKALTTPATLEVPTGRTSP